ncbi:MAG: metallophosphoesterase [Candidatus Sedimenticola sp. (ex Thyasira tokunagai)]
MKLAVLHLSDIHIHGMSDKILDQASIIASGFYDYARDSDGCLIIVTGDLAYSGQKEEYQAALELLIQIKTLISEETKEQEIDIILTPGNHDCTLIPLDSVRAVVIEQVISDNNLALDPGMVKNCTAAQKNFFEFRDCITTTKPVYDHELWTEYEIEILGHTIRLSAVNASWMSRIPETQGQLVFPIDSFKEVAEKTASLRLTLLHHPLNWYAQKSYHPLRQCLRKNSHAILSGHEHIPSSGIIIESSIGDSLFFEAQALQPHEEELTSGFSCLMFHLSEPKVKEKRFEITTHGLALQGNEISHNLPTLSRGDLSLPDLSSDMITSLSDAGGNFTHPEKGSLNAEDVFVYPELEEKFSEHKNIVSSEGLDNSGENEYRLLILGDDKSGKSFLLKRYFADIHSHGRMPLYIKASIFKSVSDSSLQKILNRIATEQYENPNDFILSKKSSRIALLDDIDRCPGGSNNKYKLISYLETHFGSLILTGSSSMEISELIDKNAARSLENYQTYEIRSFGHLMRHKLITKWCLCGDLDTTIELDRKVHETESLIDNVLGRNLVPSSPIYLLILLQSSSTHTQDELQSSGLSYYYQYMITKSLKESGVNPDQFNEIFNYISQLAWFFHNEDSVEVETSALRGFNIVFSEKYTSVDFEHRIKLLRKSKILMKNGNFFSFLYPYVYYFFLGKYLATNLYKPETRDLVSSYCENLNNKNNSSAILFLSHHSDDPWLIDKISKTAACCFNDKPPLNIENDVDSLNTLVSSTSELIIKDLDVDTNQAEQRKLADEINDQFEDQNDVKESEGDDQNTALELINNLNQLLRTCEILGQITKNYYGSIERDKKQEYLTTIFDGSLRMLRSLFDEIIRDPDLFVKELERAMTEYGDKPKEYIEDHSKKIAFDLIGMICTGIIGRTAKSVSSDSLREDISTVISNNETNAYKLLGAATRLLQPGQLPFGDLSKLSKSLKSNIFAFTIFQSLIAYYLYMFHTTDSDKQKLCEIASISMPNARSLDLKGQRSRLQ